MGCWNETCAVTNTPIRYGASNVKMVLFTPLHMDAEHMPYHYQRMVSDPVTIRRRFFDVLTGNYNDYGNIENSEAPQELDAYKYFFVNGDAWNAVVEYVQTQLNNPDEYSGWEYKHYMKCFEQIVKTESFFGDAEEFSPEKESRFRELLCVLCFLQYTRRDPWIGDKFRGSQSMNLEEHKLIAEQIIKIAESGDDEDN